MKTITTFFVGIIFCVFTFFNLYLYLNRPTIDCSHCPSPSPPVAYTLPLTTNVTIYFITPTYSRPVQKAELTRLSQTLLHVPKLHWIVVEDAYNRSSLVSSLLRQTARRLGHNQFQYTHLYAPTPSEFKTTSDDPNWLKPRGVWQRNKALEWLRANRQVISEDGVVYFGDDDNTYDLMLFEEIRSTRGVSAFAVGLVGGLLVEKPIVTHGKVVGFNSMWNTQRKFPIDMAAFAVNLRLLLDKPEATFSEAVQRGYQETHLLSQLIDSIDQLEPKGRQCRQVLVWHTRTEKPKLRQERKLKVPSNWGMLDD